MQTTKHPYELLIRWDQAGRLAGAHVQYRYITIDGEHRAESLGAAEPLTLDTAPGFPLADLLTQAQADALTAKAASDADLGAAVAALEAETQARVTAEGQLAQAVGTVDRLLQQRDALLARVAELDSQKNGEAK
ncbi:hypothetical protein [Azospirillum tabaci]|uniref:hypothetical protein n=1 Tax=Azospirillum tabaci TaxID=2752310 RepID=UPI0016612BA8|nr:hypothetical protein [Azospirillum tabaci]